jgi:hypothetical protein
VVDVVKRHEYPVKVPAPLLMHMLRAGFRRHGFIGFFTSTRHLPISNPACYQVTCKVTAMSRMISQKITSTKTSRLIPPHDAESCDSHVVLPAIFQQLQLPISQRGRNLTQKTLLPRYRNHLPQSCIQRTKKHLRPFIGTLLHAICPNAVTRSRLTCPFSNATVGVTRNSVVPASTN